MVAVILQFAALPTIAVGFILRIMFSFGLGFGYVRGDWTFKQSLITFITGLYMIGYGKGKIILKFPPFFRLNEENQEWEIQIQNQMKTKMFLFLFSFDVLNFPALDFPHSI